MAERDIGNGVSETAARAAVKDNPAGADAIAGAGDPSGALDAGISNGTRGAPFAGDEAGEGEGSIARTSGDSAAIDAAALGTTDGAVADAAAGDSPAVPNSSGSIGEALGHAGRAEPGSGTPADTSGVGGGGPLGQHGGSGPAGSASPGGERAR